MKVEKTAMFGPEILFSSLVDTYVDELKKECESNRRSGRKKPACLNITEEKLSDRIVQEVKRKLEADGYLVEGPDINLICQFIMLVHEPEADQQEVAIEKFRSYAWHKINWACLHARSFPHRINVYRDTQDEHIRVVLRELRRLGWKAYYRKGAEYFTVDFPSEELR